MIDERASRSPSITVPRGGDDATAARTAMQQVTGTLDGLKPATAAFYARMLEALHAAGVPFLVGGAYAFARYTGVVRHTKDFDVFVRQDDLDRVLDALAGVGCVVDRSYAHWFGKAVCGEDVVDVIHGSGNGLAAVDAGWFAHAVSDEVFGLPVRLCPPEEMLWSKAFVQERERFDGADVLHLLRARAEELDWPRLLWRFGEHWRVLLAHLVLFGYVYPAEQTKIPAWVMDELVRRLKAEPDQPSAVGRVCRGTLLSRSQYLTDVEEWGYRDSRLPPYGVMTPDDIDDWTDAIAIDGSR
jgi:hypothetical protein